MSVTGKVKFFNETKGFLSVASCNSGPSAPTNGLGSTSFPGECWANTTTSLWQFFYTPDGANWVEFGTLDTVALKWTPYFGGSPIAASSPVTYSVNAGLVTISCPTCLTAQNVPLGQKVGGLGISPGGLLYAGPFGSQSMPAPFGIGQVPLSNGKGAPSWSQWTVPSSVQAGNLLYAAQNNIWSALALPPCANDGAHALVFASNALACESITVAGAIATTGFVNALRNASLTAWFHGVGPLTITTSGGWCAEGVYVKPTGASVTCQQTTTCPTGNPTYYCLKITSATSVTAIQVRWVVESFTAAKLDGAQTTFQFLMLNNCGASVTPTIQAIYPTAQDNYGATGTDLSSANMQAIANGASQIEAYSWQTNASINNGDSIDVGFGACGASASDSFTIGGGFDWRATASASTGTVASPPSPEIRDAESDIRWNQRFFSASYANGSAPGTATHLNMVGAGYGNSSGQVIFPAEMRAVPSILWWDGAGNASKVSDSNNGATTFTDNQTASQAPFNIGTHIMMFQGVNSATIDNWIHYTADASLTGA